jgi:hypothetical protein
VLRTHPNAREVSRHVTELPAEFEVQRLGEHWLVAGPTGIFAVGRAERDVQRDAERTSLLAHEVRSGLSETISWVPFVDALLVVRHDLLDGVDAAELACTVVGADMLPVALTSGVVTIDDDQLAQVYRSLPVVIHNLQHRRTRSLDRA